MEHYIIKNEYFSIQQATFDVAPTTHDEPPSHFSVILQHFALGGIKEIRLTLEELEAVRGRLLAFKEEQEHEWEYPMTHCCKQRRPRSEVKFGLTVICKMGFGCKTLPREQGDIGSASSMTGHWK